MIMNDICGRWAVGLNLPSLPTIPVVGRTLRQDPRVIEGRGRAAHAAGVASLPARLLLVPWRGGHPYGRGGAPMSCATPEYCVGDLVSRARATPPPTGGGTARSLAS